VLSGATDGRDVLLQYQSDYVLRIIEQMGVALRQAFERYRDGEEPDEPLEMTSAAIGLVVDMDPQLFLKLSPQSMVSFIEISGFDDRLVDKLVEALTLEADILESEGNLVTGDVRRSQAGALRDSIDPARAN
jgi:hypothetical protein